MVATRRSGLADRAFGNGGLITIPGGIPIKNKDGQIIGAIGASGSTAENDRAVAEAGVNAVK